MNTELLLRVADHIDAFPESFKLETWAEPAQSHNICDTVGCVAGWAVMLTDPSLRARIAVDYDEEIQIHWGTRAIKALELDPGAADILFMSNMWWAHQMDVLGFTPDDEIEFDPSWIALDRVPPKAAAEILRGVASGLINLDGDRRWWVDD